MLRSDFTKFTINGVRCVIVSDDDDVIAYLNLEDAPDVLFMPISYRGGLPKILEGKVRDEGSWTGWVYPPELPTSIDQVVRQMAYVIKEAKQ